MINITILPTVVTTNPAVSTFGLSSRPIKESKNVVIIITANTAADTITLIRIGRRNASFLNLRPSKK